MTMKEFIHSEVALYDAEGHNRLAIASVGAIRCEDYLGEIVRRYEVAGSRHGEVVAEFLNSLQPGTHAMTAEQIRMQATRDHQGMLVHLEIESYYLFAKILLDRIAQFMHWWFAETPIARGISVQRHSKVVDNLGKLIVAGSLTEPEGLVDIARELQTRISDYRDDEITHDTRHTFVGTVWSPDGKVSIAKTGLGSGKGVPRSSQSEHINELDELRSRYTNLAMQFLSQNRSKGKLHLHLKGR